MGRITKKVKFGIIKDSNPGEEKRYCPRCKSSMIGPREYGPHEYIGGRVPKDSDKWLQCFFCTKVFAKYESQIDSEIEGFAETTDSPFDKGDYIEGIDNKRPKSQREKEREKILERIANEPEADIREALKRGATVTMITDEKSGNEEQNQDTKLSPRLREIKDLDISDY